MDGLEKKIEEYEARIAHLEYQLAILKRKYGEGADEVGADLSEADNKPTRKSQEWNVLVFSQDARVARLALAPASMQHGASLARFIGAPWSEYDQPRLLLTTTSEELLFVFSSGRVATLPVDQVSAVQTQMTEEGGSPLEVYWPGLKRPIEPAGLGQLVCLVPIGGLALKDYLVQVSRKGFMKKIHQRMAGSILHNRYIGAGVKKPPDQLLETLICNDDDRLACVTHEGYLLVVEVANISTALEQVMRVSPTDHIVSCFIIKSGDAILVMTGSGKVLHLSPERLEPSDAARSKGEAVFSEARRDQGARVAGAAPAAAGEWGIVLDQAGSLHAFSLDELSDAGALPGGILPVSFAALR